MMNKGKISDLKHVELSSQRGEKFSFSAVLTNDAIFRDLFVHHEIIPPQRKASAPHSHSRKEEIVFVLSGSIRAHQGAGYADLGVGEYVGFAPGGEKHYLENITDDDATCLVVCSHPQKDGVNYC